MSETPFRNDRCFPKPVPALTPEQAYEHQQSCQSVVEQAQEYPADFPPAYVEQCRQELGPVSLASLVLPKLPLVKFDPDNRENADYPIEGTEPDDHFAVLGEALQAPGHVIVLNLRNGQVIRGYIHPDRFVLLSGDET